MKAWTPWLAAAMATTTTGLIVKATQPIGDMKMERSITTCARSVGVFSIRERSACSTVIHAMIGSLTYCLEAQLGLRAGMGNDSSFFAALTPFLAPIIPLFYTTFEEFVRLFSKLLYAQVTVY